MSGDEGKSLDDRLAELLADYDDLLAAGQEASRAHLKQVVDPALLPEWNRLAAFLTLVEQAWPRDAADPGRTTGQASPGSLEPGPDAGTGTPELGEARFGRFQLQRTLGQGGFGVVFLAWDPALRRQVAVKIPQPEALVAPESRKRFLREAHAAAALDHPNIVPVYESGSVGTVAYIASAYCPGPTLAEWLARQTGPVPVRDAASLIATLARAVEHAHERGVLHRDLKPSNILLQHPGAISQALEEGDSLTAFQPRITDFSLARIADGEGPNTKSGVPFGSPPYMAPEQAEGRLNAIGPPTDVYGLGCILYELLTGRPPFRGESQLDTLRHVIEDDALSPRSLRREIPAPLEGIALKCLEKDPFGRYATAGELADDLDRFQVGEPTRARPPGYWEIARRTVRRHRVALTALVSLAIVTAVALAGISRYESRMQKSRNALALRSEEVRRSDEAARRARFLVDLRRARSLIDGHHARPAIELLNQHRPGPGGADLGGFVRRYLLGQCDTSRRTLGGFAGPVYFVEFSPRGDLLAAASQDGTVRIWKTSSWELLRAVRADQTEANVATFSPDGTLLATVGDEGTLKLWDVATGQQRFERPAHRGDAVVARFTPDGQRILTGGRTDGMLKLWDVRSGTEIKAIRAHSREFECAAASPDGKFLATCGSEELKLWDISGLRVVKALTGTTDDFLGSSPKYQGIAFSHDGSMLAIALEGQPRVQVREVPTLDLRHELVDEPQGVFAVVFAPDDRTLFSTGDDANIRCWDAATGDLKWVRHGHTGKVWGLAVSPDGRTVASASNDGTVKLWDPEPPREHDTITIEGQVGAVQFSRDGKLIATMHHDGRYSIRESGKGRLIRSRLLDPSASSPPLRGRTWSAIAEDLRTVMVADTEGTVVVWDAEQGRFLAPLGDRHNRVLLFPAPAPDSVHAFLIRPGRQAEFWDLRGARRLKVLQGDYGGAIALPDGHRWLVVRADEGNHLLIWEPMRDRVTSPRTPIRFRAKCSGLSLDGRRVAFCNLDNGPEERVRLLDIDALVELRSPIVSPVGVSSIAFDPTGRILAGGCDDHRVRLWDIASGDELLTLEGHSGAVSRVQFFPDGRTLATAASIFDGNTRLEIFLWWAAARAIWKDREIVLSEPVN